MHSTCDATPVETQQAPTATGILVCMAAAERRDADESGGAPIMPDQGKARGSTCTHEPEPACAEPARVEPALQPPCAYNRWLSEESAEYAARQKRVRAFDPLSPDSRQVTRHSCNHSCFGDGGMSTAGTRLTVEDGGSMPFKRGCNACARGLAPTSVGMPHAAAGPASLQVGAAKLRCRPGLALHEW